jgi:hypothetical protein
VSGLLLVGKARSSKCARTGTWMSGAVMTLAGLDCSGVQDGRDCRIVDRVPFSESVCDEQLLAASTSQWSANVYDILAGRLCRKFRTVGSSRSQVALKSQK